MDLNSGGVPHWILATPPKPAPLKRTPDLNLNSQGIPDLESLLDVPVVLLTPFPEKLASSSVNKIMSPPLAPITPDKGMIEGQCNHQEAAKLLSGSFNKKRRVEFNMLRTVQIEEQTVLHSNSEAPITPAKVKSAQADNFFDERYTERNIKENSMNNNRASFRLAESLPGIVSSETPDTKKGEEDEGKQEIDLNKTPEKKTPKRKKHRPKVIREDKPKNTPKPATPRTSESKEKPVTKRTYVRRKKLLESLEIAADTAEENKERLTPKRTYNRRKKVVNSVEDSAVEVEKNDKVDPERILGNEKAIDPLQTPSTTVERTTNPHSSSVIKEPLEPVQTNTTKLARRQLNFSAEEEATYGYRSSAGCNVQSRENRTDTSRNREFLLDLNRGLELFINESSAGTEYDAYALNCATKGFLDEYLSLPQSDGSPSNQFSGILESSDLKVDTDNGIGMPNHKGKLASDDQVDDVLLDLNIVKSGTKSDHSRINYDQQQSANGLPRDILFPHGYKELDENNLCHDLIPLFPMIYKKRRTLMVRKVGRHTFSDVDNSKELDELQEPELMLALAPSVRMTKKRSKVPTRARKLSSMTVMNDCSHLLWSPERIRASLGVPEYKNYRPEACMEALSADTRFKITKKPRNKEYFDLVSSMPSTVTNEWHEPNEFSSLGQNLVVGLEESPTGHWKRSNHIEVGSIEDIHSRRFHIRGSLYASFQSQEIVPYMNPVDIIVEKMKHLKINEGRASATRTYTSIIPYGGGGMMVPYGSIFQLIKKQRPRAKVDLDPETNRVWNLLMGKKSSDEDDEQDLDNEKWWEEERRVFRGRAESFIARMHLILGDRRFSKWKGSVVDSVVGVFLTQNVSDHLSSSAFMSLASRFPIRSGSSATEASAENISMSTEQEDESILVDVKWQENLSIPVTTYSDSTEISENERNDRNEIDHSKGNDLHPDESGKKIGLEPIQKKMGIPKTTEIIFVDDLVDTISSQKSVVSSEGSPECLSQMTTHVNLDSRSLTLIEDLTVKKSGDSDNSTSLMENAIIKGATPTSDVKVTEGSDPFADSQTSPSDSTATTTVESNVSGSKFFVQISACSKTEICIGNHEGCSKNLPHDKIDELLGENTSPECPRAQDEHAAKVSNAKEGADFQAENACKGIEILTATQYYKELKERVFSCNALEETVESSRTAESNSSCFQNVLQEKEKATLEAKKVNAETKSKNASEWESLREEAFGNGAKSERSSDTMDSLDWEAVRNANVNEISNTIRERGMNNVLAQRIKDFLNRLVKDHGSIDLEWLRDVPPDKAKEYLLSIRGLGIKSVECVRLLTLQHLAFPVDTNVGRICVRLGWVPLQPLPESLQLHLLELYPMIEHIQKYIWPRLCNLDQRMLYELHYQMITFGKVFCTKTKPNCNACPMRGECKHFASAFASARLALPGPEEKRIVNSGFPSVFEDERNFGFSSFPQPQLECSRSADGSINKNCEPIIEEPASPVHESIQTLESEIEDAFCEDPEEIPVIKLSLEEFKENLKNYMQENNMEIEDGDMSKSLVAITAEAASIPMPKLKNVNRLRTEHQVFELPDSHPLLEGVGRRVPDDPCPYLLAIWTPGETAQSTEPPQSCCNSQDSTRLCERSTCFTCNSVREAEAQTVRGTLLIPCRTAMRGSFPLNGTYFQVNEVFADHSSSRMPIYIPRNWIWNLPRRTVYFGTSVSTIFKGLTMEGIQQCFWRGFVCVRGFDRASRAPRPLYARLHFPPSRAVRNRRGATEDERNRGATW